LKDSIRESERQIEAIEDNDIPKIQKIIEQEEKTLINDGILPSNREKNF